VPEPPPLDNRRIRSHAAAAGADGWWSGPAPGYRGLDWVWGLLMASPVRSRDFIRPACGRPAACQPCRGVALWVRAREEAGGGLPVAVRPRPHSKRIRSSSKLERRPACWAAAAGAFSPRTRSFHRPPSRTTETACETHRAAGCVSRTRRAGTGGSSRKSSLREVAEEPGPH
jgi:hypothetical protein